MRSWWRAWFAMAYGGLYGVGAPAATVLGTVQFVRDGDPFFLALAVVMAAVSAVALPVLVQTLRALAGRPRLRLEPGALVIRYPVLFRRPLRVAREDVQGAAPLDRSHSDPPGAVDYSLSEVTPFREPLNLEVRLHGSHLFEGARGKWTGNWIWHCRRPWATRPQFPEPGLRYRRLRLRVRDPGRTAEQVGAWAAQDQGRK
ncbi:hypothetical protein DPM19_14330 [Actinomadura craniellae]|uniref:Uncharacterized protein n=1 Tax=Actinomadura craniellae TaxID=2231787 RepID=A0A365H726_9ACTN|nr:hypothetical protein [Actinomadura craniellae]RAY14881.1 hypothetical protein DPM19_14330 [Actinomadura craniellae]